MIMAEGGSSGIVHGMQPLPHGQVVDGGRAAYWMQPGLIMARGGPSGAVQNLQVHNSMLWVMYGNTYTEIPLFA